MDQVETEFFEAEDMVKGMTEVYRRSFLFGRKAKINLKAFCNV